MRKFPILLITFVFLFACKKDDQSTPAPKLQNCAIEYLNFSDDYRFAGNGIRFPPIDALKTICSYEYKNDKIIKVTGGLMRAPIGSNFSNLIFSREVSDSIVYIGNEISVYSKYVDLFSANPNNPTIYTIDAQDKIQKLILSNGFEIYYSFSNNEITEKNKNGAILRKLYMEGNNLVKIVKESTDSQGALLRREEILFQEYDTNPNPFKNKYHISGAFYRSFSENNYKKTTKLVYTILIDGTFGLLSTSWFSMPIIYDDKGYPLFGTYE